MWAHGVIHDAVALVTKRNKKSVFSTRNIAALRTSSRIAKTHFQNYFTDKFSSSPMGIHVQARLNSTPKPSKTMVRRDLDINDRRPNEKLSLNYEFHSNHADTANIDQNLGLNPNRICKSTQICEPGTHLDEISITDMKTHPTENQKMPEILYQQTDRTLFANITERFAS